MSNTSEITLAKLCTENMHKKDYMALNAGMKPASTKAGSATVSMHIKKEMLNSHGSCHGGMIFTLADTAFAHACNNRNEANVAMDCNIDFLYPAFEGDELTAVAEEKHKGRNSSLYEVVVTNQEQRNIAFFRGRSYSIKKPVITNLEEENT